MKCFQNFKKLSDRSVALFIDKRGFTIKSKISVIGGLTGRLKWASQNFPVLANPALDICENILYV
jgi:hypothetical protein